MIEFFKANYQWADSLVSALGILANLIGILIGVIFIVYQVKKQLANSIRANQEQFKDGLKLQIYQKIAKKKEEAESKLGKASNSAEAAAMNIKFYWRQIEEFGMKPSPVRERPMDISALHVAATTSASEISYIVSSYLVVLPKFEIFIKMISFYHTQCLEIFNEYVNLLFRYLPVDIPEEMAKERNVPRLILNPKPSAEDQERMDQLAEDYRGACMDLSCTLYDLGVESQKVLLGHVFPGKPITRKPLDDAKFAVTMEESSLNRALKFLNENDKLAKKYGYVHEL